MCVSVCMHPQPEDRNVSMTAEIVSIPEIPTDSKSERHEREKQSERSVFFSPWPNLSTHRCNVSQDKGSPV